MGKIKFVQPIEPPSPQPSPAGRDRGQVAGCGINFCLTTAILTFMRTGCDRNLIFSNRNLATKILRTIRTNLIPPMDSRLRGNDDGGVFGVV